ncbi:hypothetical protein V6617_10065 [Pelagibacterium nitratireducens]|uniref:Uncharacterized protein n=1 Tax=Pelagibacterium nitratireducens TaxID=1046114 RepID=A0ABZ2HVP3_9HYPH
MKRKYILGSAAMLLGAGAAHAAPLDNYRSAKDGLEQAGFEVEDSQEIPCNNPNACWGYLGPTVLQATGQLVDIPTSSSIDAEDYMFMCAGAASGLLKRDVAQVASTIGITFGVAEVAGIAHHDFGPVKMEVREDGDTLACNFLIY